MAWYDEDKLKKRGDAQDAVMNQSIQDKGKLLGTFLGNQALRPSNQKLARATLPKVSDSVSARTTTPAPVAPQATSAGAPQKAAQVQALSPSIAPIVPGTVNKVSYQGVDGARGSISVTSGEENAKRTWASSQGGGASRANIQQANGSQRIGNLDVQFDKSVSAGERARFTEAAQSDVAERESYARGDKTLARNPELQKSLGLYRSNGGWAQEGAPGPRQAMAQQYHTPAAPSYQPIESDGTIGGNIVQRRTAGMHKAYAAMNNDAANTVLAGMQAQAANQAAIRKDQREQEQNIISATGESSLSDLRSRQGLQAEASAAETQEQNRLRGIISDPAQPEATRTAALQALGYGGKEGQPRRTVVPGQPGFGGIPGTPTMVVDQETATYREVQPYVEPTSPAYASAAEKLQGLKGTPQQATAEQEYIRIYGKLPEGY